MLSAAHTARAELRNIAIVLDPLTSSGRAPTLPGVRAAPLVRNRITFDEEHFAEVVVWVVPEPLDGSVHRYKYRLAFVAHGLCVLRYDNEAGKGDHRHWLGSESRYRFATLDQLFADFHGDIRSYLHEDRHP